MKEKIEKQKRKEKREKKYENIENKMWNDKRRKLRKLNVK